MCTGVKGGGAVVPLETLSGGQQCWMPAGIALWLGHTWPGPGHPLAGLRYCGAPGLRVALVREAIKEGVGTLAPQGDRDEHQSFGGLGGQGHLGQWCLSVPALSRPRPTYVHTSPRQPWTAKNLSPE